VVRRALALEVQVMQPPDQTRWTLLVPHGRQVAVGDRIRFAVRPEAVWCLAGEGPSAS